MTINDETPIGKMKPITPRSTAIGKSIKALFKASVFMNPSLPGNGITNTNILILGKPGRGGGMRKLRSYAKHWGKEIPEEFKDRQEEYFFASDASKILD